MTQEEIDSFAPLPGGDMQVRLRLFVRKKLDEFVRSLGNSTGHPDDDVFFSVIAADEPLGLSRRINRHGVDSLTNMLAEHGTVYRQRTD